MRQIYALSIIIISFALNSCFTLKHTVITYRNAEERKKPRVGYERTKYFPYKLERPFNFNWKDKLSFVSLLAYVDSNIKVRLKVVQPYLLKGLDTIKLKEVEQFKTYSYPNIINEPTLYIHFEYTVEHKKDGSLIAEKEDVKLYKVKYTFRSVH